MTCFDNAITPSKVLLRRWGSEQLLNYTPARVRSGRRYSLVQVGEDFAEGERDHGAALIGAMRHSQY